MKTHLAEYEIDDDKTRIDFAQVHAWLTTAYWSTGVSRQRVEQAAQHSSLVVGAYCSGQQAGFLRVVSDRTTFAWVADVFVDPSHRKKGLAKAMVRFALQHPEFQGIRQWVLMTLDAHPVYRQLGFDFHPNRHNLMQLRPPPVPGAGTSALWPNPAPESL